MDFYIYVMRHKDGRIIKAYTAEADAENSLYHLCRNDGTYSYVRVQLVNLR